jgi:hypothetical protein
MSDDAPDRLEIYINEQRADLELFRMIIQICLIQFLDTLPRGRGPAYLADFDNEIVNTLRTSSFAPELVRMREMIIARAERFFLSIRKAKGYSMQNTGDDPTRN